MTYDLDRLTRKLQVCERIEETPDAVSLVFAIPKDLATEFRFGPGQFVTLFLEIKEDLVPRSYSISSSPIVEPELKITIKRFPGGRGSNFIVDHIKAGDWVRVSPPSGHFFRPPQGEGPHHFVFFAGGSGITPIFSILKTVLLTQPQAQFSLVYANRSPDTVIYHRELENWESRFSTKLKVYRVYSSPPSDWKGLKGRCEGELLTRLIQDMIQRHQAKTWEVYLCGPDGFMSHIRQELLKAGIGDSCLHQESFTTATTSTPNVSATGHDNQDEDVVGRVYIGEPNLKLMGSASRVEVCLGGNKICLDVLEKQTILEALIEAGANPPYSCLEGNCMACVAKVTKGRVYQNDPGILLDENIAAGEVLTCQAHPSSSHIEINYDAI